MTGELEITDHRGVAPAIGPALPSLLVERMEEPAPPEGFLARAPEYRDAATIPRLLLMVARKLR